MSEQILLPLEFTSPIITSDDFIVGLSNLNAFNAISQPYSWPDSRLMVMGEAKSGKTALANIWAHKNGAVFYSSLEKLQDENPQNCIIDNLEFFNSEQELFHAINYTMQQRITLLITAGTIPCFKLPDLRSRIAATQKVLIHQPDEELIKALLLKKFANLQIEVDTGVVEYIISRIERSFEAVFMVVEQLNLYSLRHKKPITINAFKKI
jgi:chromosomal replication initiation ATPase DnaA